MQPGGGYGSREADERMAGALAASNTAVWELDLRTREVTWAANLDSVFRQPIDTLETGLRAVHPADEPWVRAACMATIDERRDYHVECRVVWPDGSIRWVISNARVVETGGRPPRLIGSTTDITERHTLEDRLRQLQKVEEFGRLAARAAHDFNNLLTVIHGYSHLLASTSSNQELVVEVREILQAAERARGITTELLTAGRELGLRLDDPRPAAEAGPRRRKILVIEDEAPVRALIRRILDREGFEVLEAEGASEASRLFDEHHAEIALLVADAGIPGEKGPALYRRLLSTEPALKVIYISGDIEETVLGGVPPSPLERFIGKPFTARRLLEVMKDVLQ